MSDIKYKRVLLKLSGEALAGDQGKGINPPEILKVAEEIKEVHDLGVQIAIVVAVWTLVGTPTDSRLSWSAKAFITVPNIPM